MSAKDLGILWLWLHGIYCLIWVSSGFGWLLTFLSVIVVGIWLFTGD